MGVIANTINLRVNQNYSFNGNNAIYFIDSPKNIHKALRDTIDHIPTATPFDKEHE
jgi:hypothetical protein